MLQRVCELVAHCVNGWTAFLMPRFIAPAFRTIHCVLPETCPAAREIAAELRQKTRHLLKAAGPELTRRDLEAAEVSSIQQHPRSRSNGALNASSWVTDECRAASAFTNESK